MVKDLLIRGMLAGLLAGVLAFGFARVFAEPEIEYGIGIEEFLGKTAQHRAHARAREAGAAHEHASAQDEEELVSRSTQAGIGMLTAIGGYGAGLGGLFAIAFAFAYGRVGQFGPRATAGLLAAAGFIAVALVPFLKYPALPPAVGNPESLGYRTSLYLAMIAISIIAAVLAIGLARRLRERWGAWLSAAAGVAAFISVIAVTQFALPNVGEVPPQFALDSLRRFQLASLGTQALLWAALGILFGWLSARLLDKQRPQ